MESVAPVRVHSGPEIKSYLAPWFNQIKHSEEGTQKFSLGVKGSGFHRHCKLNWKLIFWYTIFLKYIFLLWKLQHSEEVIKTFSVYSIYSEISGFI